MHLLAYDLGTSALKSTLIHESGKVTASVSYAYPTRTADNGTAEQDPESWWQGVCETSRRLLAEYPQEMKQVAAVGTSGQMLGCLPLDRHGDPLHPAMIHSDRRSVREYEQISQIIGKNRLYRLTGNVLDPRSSLCKVLWLKANLPQVYAETEVFVQAKDFIVGRLTGHFATTDHSDASHAQWIDITKKDYLVDVFSSLAIDTRKFPRLHRGTDIVGHISASAALATGLRQGVPVAAGGGDGACANLAAGLVSANDIYCSLGTTAWLAFNSAQPLIDQQERVFNILSLDGDTCGVFGTIQNAGKAVAWAVSAFMFDDPQQLDQAAAAVSAGSEGLVFLPYLDGERSPIFDPDARGLFFGLSGRHQRGHFARAVLEGTAFALKSIFDVFTAQTRLTDMRLIGGGARSDLWRQILADILAVNLWSLNIPSADATSIGAALAAGVGIGLYADLPAAAALVKTTQPTRPDHGSKAVYDQRYAVYSQLYPRLKDLFHE